MGALRPVPHLSALDSWEVGTGKCPYGYRPEASRLHNPQEARASRQVGGGHRRGGPNTPKVPPYTVAGDGGSVVL